MRKMVLPLVLVGLTLAGLFLLSAPVTRDTIVVDRVFVGQARVTDGDTLRINGVPIRLHGIDAPERDQDCTTEHGFPFACGGAATDALRARLEGQEVTCQHIEYDRYDRSVARCYVDGADVGQEMVVLGYAIAYRRYSTEYVADEDAARSQGAGFWSANMQTPSEYRRLGAMPEAAPDPNCAIKGNISDQGRIFHVRGQEFYDRTRINTRSGERWFCSVAEAISAGWRASEI